MMRRIGIGLAAVLGIALLVLAVAFGLAQTAPGQRWITAQLARLASTPELVVELDGLEGLVPFDMTLARFSAANRDGVWLNGRDTRLAWSAAALLEGRLLIETARIGELQLTRLPPSEPSAPEPLRLPELPSSIPPIAVDQLAVDRLELGQAVLGAPASFRLAGRLAAIADGRAATIDLELARLDQASASAILSANLTFDPLTLELDGHAEESGGLVAALTGQPQIERTTLDLAGTGPLDAWQGQLQAEAVGFLRVAADLEVGLDEHARLALDGTVVPAPGVLPDDLAPLLGDHLDVTLAMRQTGPQQVKIEALHLRAAAAELTSEATLDFEAARIAASAALTKVELAQLGDLAGIPLAGSLRVDLTTSGDLLQPQSRVSARASDVVIDAVSAQGIETALTVTPTAPLTDPDARFRIEGDGRAEGLHVANLPEQDLGWRLAATVPRTGAAEIEQLAIDAADLGLVAHGVIDPATLAGSGQIDLQVAALRPFAERIGQQIDGAATLRADVVLAAGAEQIDGRLGAALESLAGLPPGAAELIGPAPTMDANFSFDVAQGLAVDDLILDGAAATLGGRLGLALPDQALSGDLSLRLPDLAVLAPALEQDLAGALAIDAVLAGDVASPDVALHAAGADLTLAGWPLQNLALTATAQDLASTPAGGLEVAATWSGIEAQLTARYQLDQDRLHLPELSLTAPRSQVAGALSIDLARPLIEGELQGEVLDLAGFAAVLPVRARGRVEFETQLVADGDRQQVALVVEGSELIADFGRLEAIKARATITDAFGTPQLDAGLTVNQLRQDELRLSSGELTLQGSLERLDLGASLAGNIGQPFALTSRAELALGEPMRLALTQLDGEFSGETVQLAGPADVTVGQEELRVDGLDLRLAGGRVRGEVALNPRTVAVAAELEAMPLAVLERFGGPKLGGSASAKLQLDGAADEPRGTLDVTLSDLRVRDVEFDDLPPAQVTASAQLGGRRLNVDLQVEGVTAKPVTAALAVPITLRLQPFAFDLPSDGALEGRFTGEVALQRLGELLALDDQLLEGRLASNLTFAGTVADPQIDGVIDLEDGLYENGATGTVLHDLTLAARAANREITIERLDGRVGESGELRGEGQFELAADLPFSVEIALRQAPLLRRDDIDATISGDLKLSGPVSEPALEGRLTIDRADIGLPEDTGPDIAVIEVKEVGAGRVEPEKPGEGGFDLRLDVAVDLPGKIFVRGRGLDSEWQGKLKATGSAKAPRLTGQLEVRRGFFDFLDKRFDLRTGLIDFGGKVPPDPRVDLEAVAKTVDITAVVRLSGPATDPTLTLESEPNLPQDEVLSRLLFNREASSISPAQAVQLATAVNRLQGGGYDPIAGVRSLIGIDTLNVGGGESVEESRARAGKYLSEEIYVEVEQGAATETSRGRVEVEILPNVAIEADSGADAQSGVGLRWKYDY